MKQVYFTLKENSKIADGTWKMTLEGDVSAVGGSGKFVNIALPGLFLRRPISVCDLSQGTLTLVYKVVGKGTDAMSAMLPGETLDILTGLGNGFDTSACRDSALLLGGGVGTAPLVLLARELLSKGKRVTAVLGFNKASEIMLADELRSLGATVYIATLDGSEGTRGFVTDALMEKGIEYDYYYACGPMPMLKAVCSHIEKPGEVSLEERMGCGFGICYGCSCHTTDGPRRVCADGPVFKKEKLQW
ncbi:MAG: dihydroorotate dehydrogenase electron transfer subunit [Bacteroidales bacterium]|nr:dihydroorotate dehydrogenase electron transfer subunit [Bacteroidales bacterium]